MSDLLTSIQIEQQIDRTSLTTVLDILVDICHGKAEHLSTNWQDEYAAKLWTYMAGRFEKDAVAARMRELR